MIYFKSENMIGSSYRKLFKDAAHVLAKAPQIAGYYLDAAQKSFYTLKKEDDADINTPLHIRKNTNTDDSFKDSE